MPVFNQSDRTICYNYDLIKSFSINFALEEVLDILSMIFELSSFDSVMGAYTCWAQTSKATFTK